MADEPNPQTANDDLAPVEPQDPPHGEPKPDPKPGPDHAAEARKWEKRSKDNKAALDKEAERASAAEAGLEKLRKDFAKALGFASDDTPPDPAALQQTVAERESRIGSLESENRNLRVELAAWRAAGENGANPLALMDRRSVVDRIGALDPAADDFTTQLGQIVKAAVDADETLKAAGMPRTPKPDPSQGSGRPVPTGAERGVAEAARRFGPRANLGAVTPTP